MKYIMTPEEAADYEYPEDTALLEKYDIPEMIQTSGGEAVLWRPKVLKNLDEESKDDSYWSPTEITEHRLKAMLKRKGWLLEVCRCRNTHCMFKITPDPDRIMFNYEPPSKFKMFIIKVLRRLAGNGS